MTTKHIQHLAGRGQLLQGDQVVANVRYVIDIYQQWITARTFEGQSSAPGMKSYQLAVDVLDGEKLLDLGATYTLVLDDKRACTVAIQQASFPGTHYELMLVAPGDLV